MLSFSYRCIGCRKEYEISPDRMLCDTCASERKATEPLRGLLEVRITGTIEGEWKIADLLPVEEEWFPPIPVGNTPLWAPERMREETGIRNLYLKDDTANPTGSLKDRASFLVAAFARKHGIRRVLLASTGNAGSSMAGVGAAAGLDVTLYLPADAPRAKITQAAQYGAEINRVDGGYDRAYDEALAAVADGVLSRNTAHNPLTIEGKKTVALEIFRQLQVIGDVPDYIFVPAGDGVILSGVYRGFEDLVSLGITDDMPKIVAVQARGSDAIARALEEGSFGPPVASKTVADSIAVDVPRGGYFAHQRLERHGGTAVRVTDEEILASQRYLASRTGLFAEPAASAAVAGFLKHRGHIPSEATVVILITGNGLKDIDSAMKGLGVGINAAPGIDDEGSGR